MNNYCRIPGCERPIENRDTGLCSTHNRAARKEVKAPIKKVSEKQAEALDEYSVKRKAFLAIHKRCAVYPHLRAVEIHHSCGRIGDNLLDESSWLPVSREGHMEIEKRPEWAKAKGFSFSRLTKRG